ncbi:endo-1,3(4)-beta-glucanase [Lyophyllum atratum]|nr:endo-1,3(4)-beta-glucanase [Lyophyllum atratum]
MLFKSLPLGLVLLISDVSPASATTSLVPRAIQNIHMSAVKHTTNLARDLRVAFGGILVAQPPSSNTHAVYCKPGRAGTLGGTVGGGNDTSAGTTSSRPPSSATRSSSSGKPTGTSAASSPWKLVETHQGDNFYDGWEFFIGPDTPTKGIVEYVDQATGRASGILEVNGDGNAIMRVETTPNVPDLRKSIRITTQTPFNGGLIIMDSVHMPTGCGIWPAFWTNGPNWPRGGEIDIVEAVHDYTNNQMTIHTDVGCRLPSADANALRISGNVIGGTDCAALTTGNQGCGIRAPSSNSFGAGFNRNGGGTYAMQWDGSGIAVFFFPRGAEPADITNDRPRPETWGPAQARWPADACDPFKFFSNHNAIFDTTLCGEWAGGVWNSAGIPGQEQSCAQRTGVATCEAFVRANGASMSEAYWEVKYVKRYQFQG